MDEIDIFQDPSILQDDDWYNNGFGGWDFGDFNSFDPTLDGGGGAESDFPYLDYGFGDPSGGHGFSTVDLLNKILQAGKGASGLTRGLANGASTLGAASQAAANNRALAAALIQRQSGLGLEAAANRRTDESDAMKKLAQTAYIQQGGSHFKLPSSLQMGGKSYAVPDLGLAPPKISDAQRQGAATLEAQMLDRLKPGGSFQPTPIDQYLSPSGWEQAGNIGSMIAGGVGSLADIFGWGGKNDPSQSGGGYSINDLLQLLNTSGK